MTSAKHSKVTYRIVWVADRYYVVSRSLAHHPWNQIGTGYPTNGEAKAAIAALTA